jgi:hypothetical protein
MWFMTISDGQFSYDRLNGLLWVDFMTTLGVNPLRRSTPAMQLYLIAMAEELGIYADKQAEHCLERYLATTTASLPDNPDSGDTVPNREK